MYTVDDQGNVIDSNSGAFIGNTSQGYSVDDNGNLNTSNVVTDGSSAFSGSNLTMPSDSNLSSLANGVLGGVNSLSGAIGNQNLAGLAGATYLGNALKNSANNIAGAATTNAANIGANAQQNIANLQNLYGQQTQQYNPYIQTGNQGNAALQQNLPYLSSQFTNADLNSQLAPNYQFQLQQGLGQTQNAANATGGLVGGNALQGLQNYAQNYAQGAYQNAFNNAQSQKQNIYNTLSGIAGIGQNALGAQSGLVSNLGTNVSNISTGAAQNQAQLGLTAAQAAGAGTTNAANVYSNALNSVANNNTLAALLSKQTTPNITVNASGGNAQGGSGGSGGAGASGLVGQATNLANTVASNASGGGLIGALGSAGSAIGGALGAVGSFFGL